MLWSSEDRVTDSFDVTVLWSQIRKNNADRNRDVRVKRTWECLERRRLVFSNDVSARYFLFLFLGLTLNMYHS